MVKVQDQSIPSDKYQDLYKIAHPMNRVRENAFGTFRFGEKKFGSSRPAIQANLFNTFKFGQAKFGAHREHGYIKKRYPWRIPPYQGGGERN